MKTGLGYSLLLAIPLLSRALAAEPPLPGVPDVRANVMQMLEEARQRGETTGLTPGEVPDFLRGADEARVEGRPGTAPDLFDQLSGGGAPEVKPVLNVEVEPAVTTAPSTSRAERPAAPDEPRHLQLPQKEITIRDLQDLKALSREFQEAQQRTPQP